MREQFTTQAFRRDSLQIIDTANAICAEYQAQGYNLTLRQVYYQFVARGLLANKDTNYKRLGSIINDARLAGLIDWAYIQDRTRNVRGGFGGYTSPADFIENVVEQYVEAIWRGQEYRPEVWVEKDALVDVVARGCRQDRVPHFSCRGYVSQSEMYEAAKRMERYRRRGLTPVVIHLGDHDPSGIDMTRDIRDRLEMLSNGYVEVRRIALTMDQIDAYNPPPNPAKLTDSRGEGYVARYGDESWELDALEPSVLVDLIQTELDTLVDRDLLEERRAHEEAQVGDMREVADRWDDLRTNWPAVLDVIDQ